MTRNADKYHGILPVNKPVGMTSHDVVDRVRRIVRQRSIGHAGTLDPLADGLLVIALGQGTKIVRFLTDAAKTYEAELHLGYTSSTYDREGVDPGAQQGDVPVLTEEALLSLLREFTGTIKQHVPAYSAVHVDGRRLYEMARAGEDIETPERDVEIHRLSLKSFTRDRVVLEVSCSKGTYVRSLAHDIGQRLGCGAYLSALKRTASGRFALGQALTLEQIDQHHTQGTLTNVLVSLEAALDFGAVHVSETGVEHVRHGRVPRATDILRVEGSFGVGDPIAVKNGNGRLLALGHAVVPSSGLKATAVGDILTYDRVLNGAAH